MQAIQLATLNHQFGVPGVAEVVPGQGNLPKVVINSAAAQGEMYLHGAHVTSWKPADTHEVLFMSRQSRFEDGKPIRGGVPICFPWFGPHASNPAAPAHGFARAREWQLQSIEKRGDSVSVAMELTSDEQTRLWWPADFHLLHRATFADELTLELILTNTGSVALTCEAALHTYYRIGDISKTTIHGLDGVHFIDKADNQEEKIQNGPVVFNKETDRVYFDTTGEVEISDPLLRRRITVSKESSSCTVVWNPWWEKAKGMADLGENAWPNLVCVEACNVGSYALELAPGERYRMKAVTRVSTL